MRGLKVVGGGCSISNLSDGSWAVSRACGLGGWWLAASGGEVALIVRGVSFLCGFTPANMEAGRKLSFDLSFFFCILSRGVGCLPLLLVFTFKRGGASEISPISYL